MSAGNREPFLLGPLRPETRGEYRRRVREAQQRKAAEVEAMLAEHKRNPPPPVDDGIPF